MSFLKIVFYSLIISGLLSVVAWVYLKFGNSKTVKVFPRVYKIKKIMDEKHQATLYYSLYTYAGKFLFFNIYLPVALSGIDDYFGNSMLVKIKFNSVEDAEAYFERNYRNNLETI